MTSLDDSVAQALIASRIVGKKNSYAADNPVEAKAVIAYLNGGSRPTTFTTAMGKHLVYLEDARRPVVPTGTLLLHETFEGTYGLTPDLNPNLSPPVSDPPTVPPNADKINDQHSWTTTYPANYSVVASPAGSGRVLKIARNANQNVCWASRWTYRQPGPRYYGLRVFLPLDWRNPTDTTANGGKGEWCVSMEMNYHPFVFGGGPANLSIYGDWMKLGVVSGYCEGNGVSSKGGVQFAEYKNGGSWENVPSTDATVQNWPDNEFEVIPRGQMTKGIWHEVIVGINWTVDKDGWYKAWWRKQGQASWGQTIDFSGPFPTFNWGLDVGGVAWTPQQMLGCATWFDYGLYSPPQAWSNTYYLDNISEGTSLEVVKDTFV